METDDAVNDEDFGLEFLNKSVELSNHEFEVTAIIHFAQKYVL